jgi:hypothetical protein
VREGTGRGWHGGERSWGGGEDGGGCRGWRAGQSLEWRPSIDGERGEGGDGGAAADGERGESRDGGGARRRVEAKIRLWCRGQGGRGGAWVVPRASAGRGRIERRRGHA